MYKLKQNKISIKKIAEFLKTTYREKDFDITSISSLNNVKDNSILFYTSTMNFKFKIKDITEYDLNQLEKFKNIVLISSEEIKTKINIPIIISKVVLIFLFSSLLLPSKFSCSTVVDLLENDLGSRSSVSVSPINSSSLS